jgi:Fe2+ or Zn2+ uptake regulation protein
VAVEVGNKESKMKLGQTKGVARYKQTIRILLLQKLVGRRKSPDAKDLLKQVRKHGFKPSLRTLYRDLEVVYFIRDSIKL